MSEIVLAAVRQLGALIWASLILFAVIMYRREIRQLLSKFSGFEFAGLKASFQTQDESLQRVADKSALTISKEKREKVLKRMGKAGNLLRQARILWVDDLPGGNIEERKILRSFGVVVELGRSTDEGLRMAGEEYYDLIISDIGRDTGEDGLIFLKRLRERRDSTPLIFYVRDLEQERGAPSSSFGITNRPDELLHLVVDALERKP